MESTHATAEARDRAGLPPEQDLSRLPLWAQAEIRNLRDRVDSLTELLATSPAHAPIKVVDYVRGDRTVASGGTADLTVVRWDLPADGLNAARYVDVMFDRARAHVEIRSDGTGRELVIAPGSSNVIYVTSSLRGIGRRAYDDALRDGDL